MHPFIHQSLHLSIHPSIHPSIYLSTLFMCLSGLEGQAKSLYTPTPASITLFLLWSWSIIRLSLLLLLAHFVQCLGLLLKRIRKGEVDLGDNDSLTPLHCAAASGSLEHVKQLLKAGASSRRTDFESMCSPQCHTHVLFNDKIYCHTLLGAMRHIYNHWELCDTYTTTGSYATHIQPLGAMRHIYNHWELCDTYTTTGSYATHIQPLGAMRHIHTTTGSYATHIQPLGAMSADNVYLEKLSFHPDKVSVKSFICLCERGKK